MAMTAVNDLRTLGNADILKLPKKAFLCSDRFSAAGVLKSYDWATEMKKSGFCVISGFQSKLEKDVFELLLAGSQPVIMVLARGLYNRPPVKLRPYVEIGRLLIASPFNIAIKRPNRDLAFRRNQLIVDIADEIIFAHIHENGRLSQLHIPDGKPCHILDREQ
jgi:predicted Rossmann fold nucleotide-binding protein DprA/Smf involved in DNA uptake